MIVATGPVRVVLLNAGKYEHADVELDRSLHLAGPNNIGKTTLVHTLQFLYVDDARAMHFADKSLEETRRYYFPGLHSYVLFECLCRDRRFRVVGLRGLGPAKAYAWERFVIDGPYAADDFVDAATQRLREPEAVLARLALKGYRALEPREMRTALIGDSSDGTPALGLLPLRNRSDYERFRTLFLHLLRLAHLRQEDLKQLFVQAHAADFRQPEIRLSADFAQSYRTVQRQKREVDALTDIEPDARAYLERHAQRLQLQRERMVCWRSLQSAAIQTREAQLRALQQLTADRGEHELALQRGDATLAELRSARDATLKRLGAIDAELAQRDELRARFGDVLPELESAARDNLSGDAERLRQSLSSIAGRSPAAIAREHAERERELAQRSAEQAALADNLAGWLRNRLPPDALDPLFRLLNPALLGLAQGRAGIEILDAEALLLRLQSLLAGVQDGCYCDTSTRVALAALPAPALARYADPVALAEAIVGLQRDLERLAREQVTATDSALSRQQLADLERRLAHTQQRLAGHAQWQDAVTRCLPAVKERRERERELTELDGQAACLVAALEATRATLAGLDRERSDVERELRALERTLQALEPPPQPAAPGHEAAGEGSRDWRALAERFSTLTQDERALARLLDDALPRLGKALPRLPGDETFADALAQELDGLAEKRTALASAWRGFIAGLTAAFDAQLADLDRLRVRIDTLNRLLKQAHVSDLKELRLSLRELPESCGLIKHFVEQHKASAGADLFADRAAFARAEQRVGEFLEQRSLLQLTDLFQLEFEVTRANGIVTRYPHLDRIESNGTSITIKVLTLLTLLRGLMREREGYRLPFFLDEANALDRANLRAIVRLAESFGFAPVLASPDGSDAAARVYVPVRLANGKVTLTGRNALTLERTDAQPEPGAAPTAD